MKWVRNKNIYTKVLREIRIFCSVSWCDSFSQRSALSDHFARKKQIFGSYYGLTAKHLASSAQIRQENVCIVLFIKMRKHVFNCTRMSVESYYKLNNSQRKAMSPRNVTFVKIIWKITTNIIVIVDVVTN